MVSRISGKVTAATLDSNENVQGHFVLKSAIGELGVPLSPDSLVLPKEANSLPADLRQAVLGLLGKAHAVATAPAAALPPDVRRFSKKIVIDRAVQTAEAGMRVTLHDTLSSSAAQLLMDFLGSDTARLDTLFPNAADRAFELDNMQGFDELRRLSVRGDCLADVVATILSADLTAKGPQQFLHDLSQAWSYRPGHVAVLVSGQGLPLPARFTLTDAQGNRTGALGTDGKMLKGIPYSDVLDIADASNQIVARLILIAAPQAGAFTVKAEDLPGAAANLGYLVSVVAPNATGDLVQTTSPALAYPQHPETMHTGSYTFAFDGFAGASVSSLATTTIVDPAPTVLSVVQLSWADVLRCDPEDPGTPVGRVVAVLFSEEVTPASVQDRLDSSAITNFSVEANKVVGVALQPGRRIAFVALRDPYGPFFARQMTVANVQDMKGHTMATWTGPMESTIGDHGGVVSGRVMNADGSPVPQANVRLFALLACDAGDPQWVGISSKPADADGRYQFDYVVTLPDRILAVNQETGESRNVRFNVQRDGQRLNVDIVYLGRGTLSGTTYDERGRPLTQTRSSCVEPHRRFRVPARSPMRRDGSSFRAFRSGTSMSKR
ncbi:MAG: carboxypeptidase-like regulatory domain-containing protein [Vicinamibacterales bacterium]